jgi:RNA polymerase sigma-70 factor (ECF subfamily)
MPPEASSHVLPALLAVGLEGDDPESSSAPRRGTKTANERVTQSLRDHFRTIWRALRRFGVPAAQADDAAQEVFIVAAKKLGEVPEGNELRFLYAVALRVAANVRRAQKTRREDVDEEALFSAVSDLPSSDALLEEKRMRELLYLLLEQMSDDLRTAFVLFELEGFSLLEISELCAIPLGTVSSRLRRAREAFQTSAAHFQSLENSKGKP